MLRLSLLSIICLFFISPIYCINQGFTFFSDTLGQGGAITSLLAQQCILSKPLALFSACLLANGNFVLINQAQQTIDFAAGSDVVAAQVGAVAPFRAVMQSDNNFVVLGGAGQVLFQSTAIQVAVFLYLRVTDLGTVQLQDIAGNVAWQNGIINQAGIQAIGIFAGRTGYQFGLGGPNFGGVNLGGLLPMQIFDEHINTGSSPLPAPINTGNNLRLSKLAFIFIIVGSVVFGAILATTVCFLRSRQANRTVIKAINPPISNQTQIVNKPVVISNLANENQIRPRLSGTATNTAAL